MRVGEGQIGAAVSAVRDALRGQHLGSMSLVRDTLELLPSLTVDIDDRAIELADAIRSASELARARARVRCSERDRWQLAVSSHRLAYTAWTDGSVRPLECALAVEAFNDSGADSRDTMVALGPFHIQAQAMQVDVPTLFREAAGCAVLPEVADDFSRFGARTDIVAGSWESFPWMSGVAR